ncbi:MAG: PqqD family peptide modification chaperone [Candidatus Neomarinimicrobiota bacterium]
MKKKVSADSIIVAAKDQVSADLGEEAVMLNLKSGIYFGLDPIGTRIWNLLQSQISVKEIRDAIAKEYDVDPERCEKDILDLAQEMVEQGLVEVRNETTS